jgi:hypothetical protein
MTATVKWAVHRLMEIGCEVKADYEAGTIDVYDDGIRVYMALQKGKDQPWIVATYDSDRIKWKRGD